MWICGIAYDQKGVSLHGFCPIIRDNHYKFLCWDISGAPLLDMFPKKLNEDEEPKVYMPQQPSLLKALIWMRQQTKKLADELERNKLELPPPFEDLGKAWDMNPPGWAAMRRADDAEEKQKEKKSCIQ